MSKRDNIYNRLEGYAPNELPVTDNEFIIQLFGARLVSAMDHNLKESFYEIDRLSMLNENQKSAVKEVLKENNKRFFYSILLKFRDFNYPVEVNFLNPNENDFKKIVGLEDQLEFHQHYFDWITKFSDIIDEP